MLRIVKTVADKEIILNGKADVISLDRRLTSARLIKKSAQLNACRISCVKHLFKIVKRDTRVDNIFYNKKVLSVNGNVISLIILSEPLVVVPLE